MLPTSMWPNVNFFQKDKTQTMKPHTCRFGWDLLCAVCFSSQTLNMRSSVTVHKHVCAQQKKKDLGVSQSLLPAVLLECPRQALLCFRVITSGFGLSHTKLQNCTPDNKKRLTKTEGADCSLPRPVRLSRCTDRTKSWPCGKRCRPDPRPWPMSVLQEHSIHPCVHMERSAILENSFCRAEFPNCCSRSRAPNCTDVHKSQKCIPRSKMHSTDLKCPCTSFQVSRARLFALSLGAITMYGSGDFCARPSLNLTVQTPVIMFAGFRTLASLCGPVLGSWS